MPHNTSIKDNSYLNLQWVHPKDNPSEYLFMKYMLTEQNLGICIVDADVVDSVTDIFVPIYGYVKTRIPRCGTMVQ